MLTLGELIKIVQRTPTYAEVVFEDLSTRPGRAMSYRGDYAQLAFTPVSRDVPLLAVQFLEQLEKALGNVYGGYKGGEYRMHEDTGLYCAPWGDVGPQIQGAYYDEDEELLVLALEVIDDE